MIKSLAIVFLISVSQILTAQTIVNTEKLFNKEKPGFNLSAKLTGSGIAGNSNQFSLNYSLNMAYIKEKNALKLFSGGKYVRQNKETSANNVFGQIRYEHAFNKKRKVFGFYQLQYNQILLLNRRQLLGLGIRQNFIKLEFDSLTHFKFDMSMAVMQEEEILNRTDLLPNEMYYTNYTRGVLAVILNYKAGDHFRIINTTYIEPFLKDFSDYRFLNELNMFFKINKNLAVTFDMEYRYDSKPPSILMDWDLSMSFGLLYEM